MSQIKSYHEVDSSDLEKVFDIKTMEEVYVVHQGASDAPHRHDYYTVLLIKSAEGKHIIDFHEFDLRGNQVYFISPGQVHQIIENQKSQGYIMTFATDFLVQNNIDSNFINDLHLFQLNGFTPPLEIDNKELDELCSLAQSMQAEMTTSSQYRNIAIGAWLKIFLIRCHGSCTLTVDTNTQLQQASQTILRQFQSLLSEKYETWHKVSDYADHLHITSDHLNATINQLTGTSVKAHIQNRIVVEAKRLLMFSDMSNKEIGYQLGFKEPSHFSQFFKKCVGISPSAFVKSN